MPDATLQVAWFQASGLDCAIDVMDIAEVLRPVTVTRLPHAPPFIEGLIELRGRFLPVIDLRRRLAGAAELGGAAALNLDRDPAPGQRGKLIVAPLQGTQVALLVDEVIGVERIPTEDIQSPPELAGGRLAPDLVTGVLRWNDRVLLVLDLGALLSAEEHASLAQLR